MRKSIGVVIALVLLVVLGFLFKGYLDQRASANAAAVELASNNAQIVLLSEQNQNLESQINDNVRQQADLAKKLSAARESLPNRITSSSILHSILDMCARHNITALPLSTTDWASIQIEKNNYSVYKVTLKLSGQQDDMLDCIQGLQTQLYPTLAIEHLTLSQEPSVQVDSTPSSATPIPTVKLLSTDISLAIYAR